MDEVDVILVDEMGNEIGFMKKTKVHKDALLHRAISVFIFNTNGEWLLQRRALSKYHSGGLWSNTCCTHPLPGESNIDAANRRLKQEMGMKSTLYELFSFIYKEPLDNELTEYEFDHVFIGFSKDLPILNASEVMDFILINNIDLAIDIKRNPDNYTIWFKKIYEQVRHHKSIYNIVC